MVAHPWEGEGAKKPNLGATAKEAPLPLPGASENTELDEREKTRIHKNSKMFIFLEKKSGGEGSEMIVNTRPSASEQSQCLELTA